MSQGPLHTLLAAQDALVDADPAWGLILASAWRATETAPPPTSLGPWSDLLALADAPVDLGRLRAVISATSATLRSTDATTQLHRTLGHWLTPAWAVALDALRGDQAWADPSFVDLARADPDRAVARIDAALATDRGSARAAGLLYSALVAWHDAGLSPPPTALALVDRFEAAPGGLVDQAERYVGRLRLAARRDADRGLALAEEAIDWLGVDDVHAGLWAVLARVDDLPGAVDRLRAVAPRCPGPETLLDLQSRVGLLPAGALAQACRALRAQAAADGLHGRALWVASWRLLATVVRAGATELLPELSSPTLTPWAVELATWRELREDPSCLDGVARWVVGPAPPTSWSPPPPPWAYLPTGLRRARLQLLADPAVPLPSGQAWAEAP